MIYYHADDYGINIEQSKRILRCHTDGVLNSVSIFPNSDCLEEVMALLSDDISKSIHINLAEGHCCAAPERIPLLVNDKGYFKRSFGQMLLLSFLRPKVLKVQLEREITAQIKRVCKYLPDEYALRLDSHVHYHMIPLVFRALHDAARRAGHSVEYVRCSVDPWRLFGMAMRSMNSPKPVNLLKNLVLTLCSKRDASVYQRWDVQKHAVFFGLFYSGEMSHEHVNPMLQELKRSAEEKGADLEVLFHPGGLKPEEACLDPDSKTIGFYYAPGRKEEYRALHELYSSVRG